MTERGRQEGLELQALFDGEVSAKDRERLEAGLSAQDAERLAALGDLRQGVVATLEAEAEGIDLWDGIAARLDESDIERARAARGRGAGLKARSLRRYVVAIAAVAAAALILLRPSGRGLVTDDCDVEQLEVSGAVASVFKLDGDDGVTVIWMEEEPRGLGTEGARPGSPVEPDEDEEEGL